MYHYITLWHFTIPSKILTKLNRQLFFVIHKLFNLETNI